MPEIFDGIHVGRFGWCAPPIYSISGQPITGSIRGMLKIVISDYPVTIAEMGLNKWLQGLIEDTNVQPPIHDAFENANIRCSLFADACPNMNFNRMLCLWLRFWCLPLLPATKTLVGFQLDRTLVSVNHILKLIVFVGYCPVVPLLFVNCANELALPLKVHPRMERHRNIVWRDTVYPFFPSKTQSW